MFRFCRYFVFFLMLGLNAKSHAHELKTGDLIFQGESNSNFSKAISKATADGDSVKYVHVGIIEVTDSIIYVYEASPKYGVRKTTLNEFISASENSHDHPLVTFKRLNIDFPIERVITNVKKYIGQSYDWWFLPDNDKMYCSELVYECYRDFDGNRIFNSQPMNFRSPDGSMPEFWIELFEKLKMKVPEGVSGTNPNDLSKDIRLIEL